MAETITITKTEYDQLKSDSDWLNCLNLAGVDNWEGIGYAQKLHSKWHPEEDDEDDELDRELQMVADESLYQ